MTRLRLTLLTCALGAMLPAASYAADPVAIPDEVVVRYELGTDAGERAEVRAGADASVEKALALPRAQLLEVDSVRAAVSQLESDPRVEFAEPNFLVRSSAAPSDSGFPSLWGLHNTGQSGGLADADIDWLEARDAGKTSATGVTVGVVDTGAATDHPDLAGHISSIPAKDYVEGDTDPADLEGHGTHVSGTIAAQADGGLGAVGVAQDAKILPLRALDASGSGSSADIADAFSYAGQNNVEVVNASLGGPSFSKVMYSAINAYPNTLFVVAAGNDGVDVDSVAGADYPCVFDSPNLVCVAASDRRDRRASYSNYGRFSVDIAAPGSQVLSSVPTFATVGSPASATLSTSTSSVTRGPYDLSGTTNCLLAGDLASSGAGVVRIEASSNGTSWTQIASASGVTDEYFALELRRQGAYDFNNGPLHLRLRVTGADASTSASFTGLAVRCLTPTGSTATFSGTSMAAPHVAGAAAVLSAAPGASVASVRLALLSGGDPDACFSGITSSGTRLNLASSAGVGAPLGQSPQAAACPDPVPGASQVPVEPTPSATPPPFTVAPVTTPPPSTGTTGTTGPTGGAATVQLASSAPVSGRTATLALSCRGTRTCRGVVTLVSKSGKRLGAKRFSLPAGESRKLGVRLTSAGTRLLAGQRRVSARALVAMDGGGTRTFRLALRPK